MASNSKMFFWALTSALAGFIFGFDTIVISGAEQTIQSLWQLNEYTHGLAISSALWGTVLGALLGQTPTDRLGRRGTLVWIGILYFVSSAWSALANDVVSFSIARFIGGIGIGVSTVASPLYIAEIAPPNRRGFLAGLFQFNIVFGILVAFVSNAIIARFGGDAAWRWMLGVEAFPAIIYTVLCFGLVESPRWLIAFRNNEAKALEALRALNPSATEDELKNLVQEIRESSVRGEDRVKTRSDRFWSRALTKPILLAFLVAFFNQMSGINAILYFAPRIFELTGLESQAAMLQSIGIGVTNLVFTMLGLWLIDRVGRRTLLYWGSFGYILSLGLCSWAFFTKNYAIVPFCIFAFIAAHAIGQGAVIWVLISEVFPNEHRASGQALGSFTHWIFAAGITLVFPYVVENVHPGAIFMFFGFMMLLHLLWVHFMVVETKGLSLEEVQSRLRA